MPKDLIICMCLCFKRWTEIKLIVVEAEISAISLFCVYKQKLVNYYFRDLSQIALRDKW